MSTTAAEITLRAGSATTRAAGPTKLNESAQTLLRCQCPPRRIVAATGSMEPLSPITFDTIVVHPPALAAAGHDDESGPGAVAGLHSSLCGLCASMNCSASSTIVEFLRLVRAQETRMQALPGPNLLEGARRPIEPIASRWRIRPTGTLTVTAEVQFKGTPDRRHLTRFIELRPDGARLA